MALAAPQTQTLERTKQSTGQADAGYLEWIFKTLLKSKKRELKRQQPSKCNIFALLSDVKSCSRKRDLHEGRRVHRNAVASENDSNILVASALINMYAKCGSMLDARRVFDSMEEPNLMSWTALVLGYANNGQGQVALDLFFRMKHMQECALDSMIYVAAIKACTSLATDGDEVVKREGLKRGREIHLEIGHHMDHFLQSTLVNMYAKFGRMVDAWRVFDTIKEPNVVSWTALILGYVDNGDSQLALDLFSKMKTAQGCTPNSLTYVAAIKACTSLGMHENANKQKECLERAREIHLEVRQHHMNHFLQSSLINMYAKLGSMVEARQVFDSTEVPNVVSWTAIILGYADNREGQVALDFFSKMKTAPNSLTYVAAIKACTSLAMHGDSSRKKDALERGKEIHLEIGQHHMNHFVQSTLINMYAKFGSLIEAQKVFDSRQEPNVVCWTALIVGYVDNGEGQAALDLFSRMQEQARFEPDSMAYSAAIQACGSIGALATGRKLHSEITNFTANVVTCLVDFYAKCGSLKEACEVFDSHSKARDITTWNALLAGYSNFGDIDSVSELFQVMQDQGFQPDAVTFLSMLSCCSHAGLVEKARDYLEAMPLQFRVTPSLMHYSCMVDILGRANQLDDAVALLQQMPCNPDIVTWMGLLGACHKWKNVEIGSWAFQSLVGLDERYAPAYVLMAQIYGSREMWEEQEKVLEVWCLEIP